jgi:hypothetical protein
MTNRPDGGYLLQVKALLVYMLKCAADGNRTLQVCRLCLRRFFSHTLFARRS